MGQVALKDCLEGHLRSFRYWHKEMEIREVVGFWIALVVSFPFWLLAIEPFEWIYHSGLSVAVRLGLGS